MENIRIALKKHLQEYALSRFPLVDGVVVIPHNMDLHFVLIDVLTKRSPDIETGQEGLLFGIRNSGMGKDPRVYKYLSRKGRMMFETRLELMFWCDFHELMDEQVVMHGMPCLDAAQMFVEKFRIESLSEDALIKHYYRWRCNNRVNKTRYCVKHT